MFAVYASRPNPQDPLASIVVGDRPDPDAPDGWVEVAVAASALNMHDLWTLRGVGIAPERFPMVLGMDAAGLLEDGTPVAVYPLIGDPEWPGDETLDPRKTLLTEYHQGTLADKVAVPRRNAIPMPDGMTFATGAAMGTAWLTAYRMLFTKSGLRPGNTMLVQGSSGGVSTALIQLGRAAGYRVWATGRSEEKRALATGIGAHDVFEPGARLPEKVDVVFESVGEATWAHSLRALRPGGAIICCGATTGPNAPAEIQRLVFLQLRVEGSSMGTRQEFVDLLAFVAEHHILPQIGITAPVQDSKDAFAAMLHGETAGKILLTSNQAATR